MSDVQASTGAAVQSPQPRWRPLGRIERRVVGVLVEKAKTTPEQYPMTLNGLVNGCNQKSNRDPQMQLEESDINESLDRLKMAGAVIEVQGSGRVPKFRHLMYEWLGVDKVELAVMAELLLRGAQTEGDLRGRASRMEPIADLTTLRQVLDGLRAKKLVQDVTPPGRGQIISHALYEPDELARLKAKFAGGGSEAMEREPQPPARSAPPPSYSAGHSSSPALPAADRVGDELRTLRADLAELRREIEALSATVERQEATIADLRSSLGD